MRELMPTSLHLAGRQTKSFDNRSENKAHFICYSVLHQVAQRRHKEKHKEKKFKMCDLQFLIIKCVCPESTFQ